MKNVLSRESITFAKVLRPERHTFVVLVEKMSHLHEVILTFSH